MIVQILLEAADLLHDVLVLYRQLCHHLSLVIRATGDGGSLHHALAYRIELTLELVNSPHSCMPHHCMRSEPVLPTQGLADDGCVAQLLAGATAQGIES